MYGSVTVWTSMNDGPYWVILLMYESHNMRHTSFRRLTVINGTPGFWDVTICVCFSHEFDICRFIAFLGYIYEIEIL